MDWKPLVEKRDAGNGVIEYRIEQDDSNNMVLGRECTMTITIDNAGGLVRQVGRSWKDTRARLRRLADKIDDDWTPQGIAASIKKILDCEDTEDSPQQRKRVIEDAFRDGWENGWDSYRAKAQTMASMSVTYSADEFNPDWESSRTKKKLEE